MTIKMKNTIGLMGAWIMNNVLYMFLNTFMVAYFVILTNYDYKLISIYYISCFLFLAIFFLLLGGIIKTKARLNVFRVGIILQCIYILILVLLKDNIINWYIYLGAFYGIAQGFLWSSGHSMINEHVGNDSDNFVAIRTIFDKIIGILFPIIFGVSIELTSFSYIAKVVLGISFIQLGFSLLIKDNVEGIGEKFKIKEFWLKFKKNKLLNEYYKLTACDGTISFLLDTLVTILIVMTFKTVVSLGILTTVFAICSIISIYLYQNKIKNKKRMLKISAVAVLMSIAFLLYDINKLTIVLYNLCSGVFLIILRNNVQSKRYTIILDLDEARKHYVVEHQVMSEIVLNIARIIGCCALFVTSLFNNIIAFKGLLFLVASIVCIYVKLILFTEKE